MAPSQPFKLESAWDPFQGALQEYPEIENYVGNFQVDLKSKSCRSPKKCRQYKDSIVVFKKKKLASLQLRSNIYEHDSTNLELDDQDEKKSRSSCLRCRKFKKKCTRDLPECLNCVSCDQLCIYISRKRKSSVALSVDEKRDSHCSTPSSCTSHNGSGSPSDAIDTSHVHFQNEDASKRRRFSMPIKFAEDPKEKEPNYKYTGTGYSDLYKLLN